MKLGASLWEVPPGEAAYPYHFHLGEEELVLILSGTPTLRDPAGERRLEAGELLVFLRGEDGGLYELHLRQNAVGYYEGESSPG